MDIIDQIIERESARSERRARRAQNVVSALRNDVAASHNADREALARYMRLQREMYA